MKTKRQIFALGFFDGVHLGHQALLARCCDLAKQYGCRAGVVTFANHPDELVAGNAPELLNTIDDRCRLLEAHGIGQILTLPFDKRLMATPWEEFVYNLTLYHDASGFVCGSDFRFGLGGHGNAEKLGVFCHRRGLPYAIVPEQTIDGIRVSSTHIRQLLRSGETEQAARFLGHPHILTGEVISGRKLGRTIGIPTANLSYPDNILLPKAGVYACRALLDGKFYLAVTNVGTRPTVGGNHVTVEPWLLDFEGDLYGKTLTLEFHKFLRPEKKFPSMEALREEIGKNRIETLNFFLKK